MLTEEEQAQVIETAFVVDAGICADSLYQAAALAEGLEQSGEFRARIVVLGAVGAASAVPDLQDKLKRSGHGSKKQIRIFHLPQLQGPALLEAVRLGRSQALAGCDLLHCFSLSVLDVLASPPGRKLLPGWCLSLSYWPGETAVQRLARLCNRPDRRIVCWSRALQDSLIEGGVAARRCSVIAPELPTGGGGCGA